MMKSRVKRFVALAGVFVCLAVGSKHVIPVEAATEASSRAWVCSACRTELIVTSKREIVDWDTVSKCNDYRHDPDCWVCNVTFANVYYITWMVLKR